MLKKFKVKARVSQGATALWNDGQKRVLVFTRKRGRLERDSPPNCYLAPRHTLVAVPSTSAAQEEARRQVLHRVCVCVCVRERATESERERERDPEQ